MNLNLTETPFPVTLSGTWIFIERAKSTVLFTLENGDRIELNQKQSVQFDSPIGRVEVSGRGEALIKSGTGRFTPAVEGQSLTITSFPPMEVAEGQSVAVESVPAVEIAEGQSVAVESMPAVEIAEGQSVAVESMPAVEIAEGQSVAVESMPAVEIAEGQSVAVESLPAVEIAEGQSVAVESVPAVEIAEGQSVAVESVPAVEIAEGQSVAVESLPAVEIAEGQSVAVEVSKRLKGQKSGLPLTIEADEKRRGIIIKASKSNNMPVLLMGYEIDAGEKVTLETTAGFTLEGSDGDTESSVHILEY